MMLYHFALVFLTSWMGWQDWKTREVSNALSIPLMMFGILELLFRLYMQESSAQVSLIVILVLTATALRGWMGGADWKVLVGLFGLWPMAGIFALICAGIWGVVAMLRTHDRNVSFPGIAAFSIATTLTLFTEIFIIVFS